MKDIKKVFNNLERQLRKSSWFGDDWDIYNRGEYLQLYKHNFVIKIRVVSTLETYIEAREIKQKQFQSVCMLRKTVPHSNGLLRNLLR